MARVPSITLIILFVMAVCATAHPSLERKRKPKHPYTSPEGLFIQERASKQLPGPGQHFSFGALKPWEDILAMLDDKPSHERKLLLVVRHGQAVSNYLGDTLGPDEWFAVEGTCQYDDKKGTVWDIFDADLTGLGQDQARALNSMLLGGGWYSRLTDGRPVRAVISPLTRCLHTAGIVLSGIRPNATVVEEYVRETLGEDTCDARRSVSDPPRRHRTDGGATATAAATEPGSASASPGSPCSFDKGLASLFPSYKYVVHDPSVGKHRGFGLLGDGDNLWTKDKREVQKHQVKRAKKFLDILFEHAPEQVIVVVTHSGFARSLLLAAQREPYRPQNAEMVPAIIDKAPRRAGVGAHGQDEEDDHDDVWADSVVKGYETLDLGDGELPVRDAAHVAAHPVATSQMPASSWCVWRTMERVARTWSAWMRGSSSLRRVAVS